jgi:hypothetical protein
MPRVAIVGSCISRDVWRFQGVTVSNLLYISRTSLPSLFAAPVAGFRPAATPPRGLKPQPHRALVADILKSALATLVAFRPTHLIFDFIDERFDLLSVGNSVITDSWELEASGYLKRLPLKGARRIPRLSPACDRLWLDGAREMAAFVQATPLRDATLILHGARWAEQRRTTSGRIGRLSGVEVLPGVAADIAAHNRLLARYEAAFLEVMPPTAIVEAPQDRLADEGHQWGLSPFHYVPAYYAEIWRQLAALGAVERLAA